MKYKDLKSNIHCPECNGISILEESTSSIGSIFLTYRCKCGSSFTSTDSDIVSFNNYHSKKRSIKRINKINKI